MDKLDGHPDFLGEFVPDNASDAQSKIDRLRAENDQLKDELRTLRKRMCAIRGAMQQLSEPESGDLATDYEARQI